MIAPVRTAVVPCAGLGTRLMPATLAVAKEVLPLGAWPMLCTTLLEAAAAGLEELIVVLPPGKEEVRRLLDPSRWGGSAHPSAHALAGLLRGLAVRWVEQPTPLGALDAIERGLALAPPPCAVLYPDLVHLPDQRALAQILEAHRACGETVFGLYQATASGPPRGPSARVILAEGPGRTRRIARVEAPHGEPAPGEVRTTLGLVHAHLLEVLEAAARPAPAAPLDNRRLVAALDRLAHQGRPFSVLVKGEVLDLGTMPGYLEAAARFASGGARLRGLPWEA